MRPMVLIFNLALALFSAITSVGFTDEVGASSSICQFPLYIIENQGQVENDSTHYIRSSDKNIYFSPSGVTFEFVAEVVIGPALELPDGRSQETKKELNKVFLSFDGANRVTPRGLDQQDAVFNYFRGGPDQWKTSIPSYHRIIYPDLWPGIDLVYSGTDQGLKYEFIVKPGADPNLIRLNYQGIIGLKVKSNGALLVNTPLADFEDGIPYACQTINGQIKEVAMSYALQENSFSFGFDVGEYDPSLPLILDPVFLAYCGYLGGNGYDQGCDITVDKNGYAYVVGTYDNLSQAYLAKVDITGSRLVYELILDGAKKEYLSGVAIDDSGFIYLSGATNSDENSFPVVQGPDLTFNGVWDAFAAKVDPTGTNLIYCGYIGGVDDELGRTIAIDDLGAAYLTGRTNSSSSSFPVKAGPNLLYKDKYDGYVAKVAPNGLSLEYCGYIGGLEIDDPYDVAVDNNGCAYITGRTASDESSFPVIKGPDLTYNGGGMDAFVAKVKADGLGLEYCGYIGGTSSDWIVSVNVNSKRAAFVSGQTFSNENSFPVMKGPALQYSGSADGFVACVNPDGVNLDYCGYIGGALAEQINGSALDNEDNFYVIGYTKSTEATFPVKLGPGLKSKGDMDIFMARVNAQGSDLDFCGYVAGDGMDYPFAIAVDHQDSLYITGMTESDETTFPVINGPDLTYNGGSCDAFVAKIRYTTLGAEPGCISAATGGDSHLTLHGWTLNGGRNYMVLGSVSGSQPGFPLPGGTIMPVNWDIFTELGARLFNTPVFQDFVGVLDSNGCGAATFDTLTSLAPSSVGIQITFAFALNGPWDFVSNPVTVEIVP